MQPHDLILGVGIAGLASGYLLHMLRAHYFKRSSVLLVKTDSGGHVRPLTAVDYERMSSKVAGGLRDVILGNIGALRREVVKVTEQLSSLEVVLRDAIGRIERDREQQRQERVMSDEAKHRMHAEITGLHAAITVLAKSLERLEKLWA